MSNTDEMKMQLKETADRQTFVVLGVLLQFLATPEQINDQISVMLGTVPPGVVIPLHSHADPEVFYVMEGSIEAYQATGASSGWQTATAGDTVSVAGNVKHALRNTSSSPTKCLTVSKTELYKFFRELAKPFDPTQPPAPPTPEEMQELFKAAAKYEYWLASPEENKEIGIMLG
jgi:quercetin dioxygenase-like cupin family protein